MTNGSPVNQEVPTKPDTVAAVKQNAFVALFTRLRKNRFSLGLKERQLFLLLAVIIGVSSGLLVVCFQISIEWVRLWMLGSALAPPKIRVLLAPTLGGL